MTLARVSHFSASLCHYFLIFQLTYVDFAVHVMVDNLNISGCFPDLMSSYPKLTKLRNDVAKLPAIEKWMKERPSCTYYKIK